MLRRLLRLFDFTPMAHRPPLPRRWWLYCAVAYLAPSLVLTFVPAEVVPYRDLIWLLTLVPAYLLSLHYGMKGAVAGLLMGTVLFTAIQALIAVELEPEDWRVTVTIYAAYGVLAISVGWLSQLLHVFYAEAIQGERVEVISQVAITIRHEINNSLAAIIAEAQLMDATATDPETRAALKSIVAMARRVNDSMGRLATLTRAPVVEYVAGVPMIDLERVRSAEDRVQHDVAESRQAGGRGNR